MLLTKHILKLTSQHFQHRLRKFTFFSLIFISGLLVLSCRENDVEPDNTLHIDPEAYYVDQDHPDASDDNDGRYKEDGGTGPWLTIQHMLNTLEPGQTGYVRASEDPYQPTVVTSAFDIIAFFITKSGKAGDPITISGYPGERPRIGYSSLNEALQHDPTGGFATDFGASYVTIRNFEIAYLGSSGIFTNPDARFPNVGMKFENLHIHDLIGRDNIGGIRLDGCDECIVRNNIIHNTYDVRLDQNQIDDKPYGLHSGIHGYQPGNCIIENNMMYNLSKGVFQKQADEDDGKSHIVRNNIFYNITGAAYALQIQGAGMPAPLNAEFYNNIVHDCEYAVSIPLQDVGEQGDGILIYNNTVVDSYGLAKIQEMLNIEVFNNIISGSKPVWSSSTNETTIFRTVAGNEETGFINTISYYDNNIYHDVLEHWILESNGPNAANIYDLENWQTFSYPDFGLEFNPDQNSRVVDPLFNDPVNNEYSLKEESPAKSGGRGETYSTIIGAVHDNITIGPDWSIE